jgi:uncharacterized protein (DUF1015 family)
MATIRPFQALRPAPGNAAKTAAVPYDVVTTAEARELAAGNPLSFLRVSRAEIDLPDDTDPYSELVYERAASNFDRLKRDCPLLVEKEPRLYAYRLQAGGHSQTGIAGCCAIDEYENDVIRKHERTRRDKEDDRTRHMLSLGAQTGPVFMTYRGNTRIDDAIKAAIQSEPLYDFTAPDQVNHTVWRLSEETTSEITRAFDGVPAIYIADGHHRAASAWRARERLRESNSAHRGDEEYNFFLSVLFPSDQVRILAYNRAVKDLHGLEPDDLVASLAGSFKVAPAQNGQPEKKGQIAMYLASKWRRLEPAVAQQPDDPISSLDVSVLQERVLDPILGIKDVRTDKRIEFIGGARGTAALERMVDQGSAAVAFSMFPVTVDELMAISDANQIMPPKSTWFEPKLRDGLLSHLI